MTDMEDVYISAICYSIDDLGYATQSPIAFGFDVVEDAGILSSAWSPELVNKILKCLDTPINVVLPQDVERRSRIIKEGDFKGTKTSGYFDKKTGSQITSIGIRGVTIAGRNKVHVIVASYRDEFNASFVKLLLEKLGAQWKVIGVVYSQET